jgi:hypothetical protein
MEVICMSVVTGFPETLVAPIPRLWTVSEFHRMAELGIFDRGFARRHTMLIEGQILEQHHGNPDEPDPARSGSPATIW